MADYYDHTVIQQTIPLADMTPIERLLLTRIFDFESDGAGLYLYAAEGPATIISATRAELVEALAASTDGNSAARAFVAGRLSGVPDPTGHVDLDLSGTSWEFFLQDIVRRSTTLRHISVVTAFTCSTMRRDGFGGMAVLVTRDAIIGKSTDDFIADLLVATGLESEAAEARASCGGVLG